MCNSCTGSSCCVKFWQSIPYATIVVHTLTLLGIIGFVASGAQGTISLSDIPHFNSSIVFLGPLIGIVSGVSLIPLILTFIFAVYATGYIREVIKGHHLTTCLGYSCSLFSIILSVLMTLIWILLSFLFAAAVAVYVEVQMICNHFQESPSFEVQGFTNSSLCIPTQSLLNLNDICGNSGLRELCTDGLSAGIAMSVALGFCFVVTIGLIILLMIQTSNFVKVREVSNYNSTYDVSDS